MADVAQRLGGPQLARLAQAHRTRQQTLTVRLIALMRRLWRFVDAANAQSSWARVSPRAVALMTRAQAEAARGAAEYVAVALHLQGATSDPAGAVPPGPFAGTAADGRGLVGLLGYPAFEVQAFVSQGMSGPQALSVGGRHLDRIVATEVADAARAATGVAMVADRAAEGWVRMLTPPSCSRCIILAGTTYRTQDGASFERHPQCDCIAIPAAEMVEPVSPLQVFKDMTPEERALAGWNKADQAAVLDHGADIYQVTNAKRAVSSLTVGGQQLKATSVGTTRRGLAGQRQGVKRGRRAVRLTPATIYAESNRLGWSRDELIAALKRNGYVL